MVKVWANGEQRENKEIKQIAKEAQTKGYKVDLGGVADGIFSFLALARSSGPIQEVEEKEELREKERQRLAQARGQGAGYGF